MSLPDLMQELVSGNDKILSQINLVTGIDGEKTDISAYKPETGVVQVSQKQIKESTPVVEAPITEDNTEKETTNTSKDSDFIW